MPSRVSLLISVLRLNLAYESINEWGGEMLENVPRFGKGQKENSPPRGRIDQPPCEEVRFEPSLPTMLEVM